MMGSPGDLTIIALMRNLTFRLRADVPARRSCHCAAGPSVRSMSCAEILLNTSHVLAFVGARFTML